MSGFFLPYEGRKPYLFISYAHRDSGRVLPVIESLHTRLYRLWYDEGIPAGSDWPRNIELHMRYAASVIFFVSAASLASPNCRNEIAAAAAQKKPILCLRLDDAPLSADWAAFLKDAPLVPPGDTPEAWAEKALGTGFIAEQFLGDGTSDAGGIGKRGFNGWTVAIAFGVLLLFSTAAGTYGLTRGWFDSLLPAQATPPPVSTPAPTPVPTPIPTPAPTIDLGAWGGMFNEYVDFPDAQQERAVRAALGQPEGEVLTGDILPIEALYFCGNMALKSDAGITVAADGSYAVNGAPVIRGGINDLSLLSGMPSLSRLTLVEQQIASIAPLGKLSRLQALNLAGNPLKSLGKLSGFDSLRTLHLEHTKVRDLTPLNQLPALTAVTLSADMFPVKTDPTTQNYDIILVR